MDDFGGLRPSHAAYQLIEQWSAAKSSLCEVITRQQSKLPSQSTDPRRLLRRTPAFPSAVSITQHRKKRLEYTCHPGSLLVGGQSEWETSTSDCELSNIILGHELLIGVKEPTRLEFHDNDRLRHWPGSESDCGEPPYQGNYIAVLSLAWAYVLSARWVELLTSDSELDSLPAPFDITYSMSGAHCTGIADDNDDDDDDSISRTTIDIGPASDVATLWWTKILAAGRGWEASGTVNQQQYKSPWSYDLQSKPVLKVNREGKGTRWESLQAIPPSSDAALDYIIDFCAYHSIESECDAALSAVLLFPSRLGKVRLPLPYLRPIPGRQALPDGMSRARMTPSHRSNVSRHRPLISYYITFSCNIRGMRPLLMGTFFNEKVECNLVTPWLEPIFTIIDEVTARKDYRALITILAQAEPRVASLWLGAIILGWETQIFRAVRGGNAGIDLLAAAWTGTVHSFMNFPTEKGRRLSASDEAFLKRADECRLLFLTQSKSHPRAPVQVYPPPGSTRESSLDLNIRKHVDCEGHKMNYKTWYWRMESGISLGTECSENSVNQCYERRAGPGPLGLLVPQGAQLQPIQGDCSDLQRIRTQSEHTNIDHSASIQACRIFLWLRPDGYPAEEGNISRHPWLYSDSEDSQSEGSQSSCDSQREGKSEMEQIENWLCCIDRHK